MLVRTDTGPATPVGRYSCQSLVEPTEARAAFALATSRTGVLDPPLMGALVLHRVPPEMMRNLHAKILARLRGTDRLACVNRCAPL